MRRRARFNGAQKDFALHIEVHNSAQRSTGVNFT